MRADKTDLKREKSTGEPAVVQERLKYFAEALAVAMDDISAFQEQSTYYQENALKIMSETLDSFGFRIIHDNDIDAIALVARPTIYQQQAEANFNNGTPITECFDDWSDLLDDVTPEAIKRVEQIINERY